MSRFQPSTRNSDVKSGSPFFFDRCAGAETGAVRHVRLLVEAAEQGVGLEQFLTARGATLSLEEARSIVALGGVHVAGRRVAQSSRPLHAGEGVELHTDGASLVPFVLSADALLYRDPYLLAINKPAGIETQPTPARYQGTLYAAALRLLKNPQRPLDRPELGMVQRLDRETSGVMVFSTHQRAHRALSLTFAERRVRKIYLALVAGTPTRLSGEIVSCLARGRDNRVRSVARGGREALTRFRVLQAGDAASLLEVEILTGRSHQIRAHFSEAGHPLLGDRRYGGPLNLGAEPLARQMLHCLRLELPHPISGAPLILAAPPPLDLICALALARLRPVPAYASP